LTRVKGPLHEYLYTFLISSHSVLLKIRNISDKTVEKIQTQHFVQFFSPDNRAVYEIRWKNILLLGGTRTTMWRMLIACWIRKAKNTNSQYVIIIAFTPKKWLEEAPQCYVAV